MAIVTVRAKCDECHRHNLDCSVDNRDGKLYCLRCWSDFLVASNLYCHVCKRSVATIRNPTVHNNECRRCYRKTAEKEEKNSSETAPVASPETERVKVIGQPAASSQPVVTGAMERQTLSIVSSSWGYSKSSVSAFLFLGAAVGVLAVGTNLINRKRV